MEHTTSCLPMYCLTPVLRPAAQGGASGGRHETLCTLLVPEQRVKSHKLRFGRAARQLETADSCLPSRGAGNLTSERVVLVDVPERAVIGGIDSHGCVVSPPRVGCALYSGAVDQDRLAQIHLTQGRALETSGVTNSGEDIHPIYHAVSESRIALPIHGNTAHPAVDTVVRSIGALLVERVLTIDSPDFVPARSRYAWKSFDGLVGNHGFVSAEVAVSQTEGWSLPVRQNVQILRGINNSWFWETIARSG